MIIFTLFKEYSRFGISYESKDAETGIFRLLDGYVDTLTARDASRWCSSATIGEEYKHSKFRIICEEI